ncbi:ribulose bisphosphate carboxylase small subunit [soil metagenome]
MVAQNVAPANPRLSRLIGPTVDASANIHEFSLLEGDVRVGAGALVSPGTAVTAEAGAAVVVGDRTSLLPGVIIEGASGAQVMGDRGPCSVWLGDRTVVAHKSIIHSPAFIGKDCFICFRSTVFNARLGDGCVVMMHALIQDVEVPPGKQVPSGSVITSQHQADQLPDVRPQDLELAREAMGSAAYANSRGQSQQGSYASQSSQSRFIPIQSHSASVSRSARQSPSHQTLPNHSYATEGAAMQTQRLAPEIVQQVRQHLSQGYRIGMEHADKRHYRSGVWETCPPVKDTREQAVFAALEQCLSEHSGEYVRMFGIDPQVKRRVNMVTVQRADDRPVSMDAKAVASSSSSYSSSSRSSYSNSNYSSNGNGSSSELSPGVAQEVRNLLQSGYIIGTEHADPRHYRSNVWKVCSPIKSNREQEVFSHLEHCLDEHSGEYVRMFGIDPQVNRRTANTTIQRADGKPVNVSPGRPMADVSGDRTSSSRPDPRQSNSQGHSQSHSITGGSDEAAVKAIGQIVRQGNQIGVEYADARRYRSGIWQTAPILQARNESGAISQLQRFLNEHADKYVRIFGINSAMKTRTAATTIQKPGKKGSQSQSTGKQGGFGQDPINENPPHYDDPAYLQSGYLQSGRGGGSDRSGGMDPKVMDQVTQLVNQGHKISVEYADKRRYRSGIWKTGAAISAQRPAEAISALGKQLAQHRDDYVKLVGIDPQAKRRVVEMTIQKPGQGVSGTGPDPINANPPHYDDPAYRGQPSSYGSDHYSSDRVGGGYGSGGYSSNGGSNGGSSGLESKVMDQVTQLVNQGHRISVEYADKRRYRSGIWKTGEAIDARRPAEAISALGKQLARHQGDYVRLVGVDPQAKRRVLETTIQRP